MAILVRTAVVKLHGEGRGEELREGASHSLLVKTFTDSHVVGYISWLKEHEKDRSVFNWRDRLKEKVSI